MAARKLTEAQIALACEMRERGRSCASIAIRLGVSEGAISWRMLERGAEPPKPGRLDPVPTEETSVRRGAHVVRRFTRDEDARLLALNAQGLSPQAIGHRLGRRHNSIKGRLMTLARREARAEAANGSVL